MGSILIVDDDDNTALLIQTILSSLGHTVWVARNSDRGWKILSEKPVDLILLDMRLPGENGWEMATRIKQEARLMHIPILAVSVPVRDDDRQRALQAGCAEYITKPFQVTEFRQIVRKYLSA